MNRCIGIERRHGSAARRLLGERKPLKKFLVMTHLLQVILACGVVLALAILACDAWIIARRCWIIRGFALAMQIALLILLAGRQFVGLNGGPHFTFNEAVSFQIYCDDQKEVDRLTAALSAFPEAEQCGWVKDRFGLSWQIVPRRLLALMTDPDATRARRAMQAMMTMKRIDIAAVERAAGGDPVS